MRVLALLLALALAAARPGGGTSDRRAVEELELAIAQNRTMLQRIGVCSVVAAGESPRPPEHLAIIALHLLRSARGIQLITGNGHQESANVARTTVRLMPIVQTTRSAATWAVWYVTRPTSGRGTRKLALPSS